METVKGEDEITITLIVQESSDQSKPNRKAADIDSNIDARSQDDSGWLEDAAILPMLLDRLAGSRKRIELRNLIGPIK